MIDPRHPDFANTPVSPRRPSFDYQPLEASADPYVTIVTPLYNTGRIFHETAESVRRQSFQQWEWVVVNDGSADTDTLAVLSEYRQKDSRIHIIDLAAHQGRGTTLNLGFQRARAGFVALLDGGNLLEPTAIEKWLWFLETEPAIDFVKSYAVNFGAAERLWTKDAREGNSANINCMIRREAYQAVGGYDESLDAEADLDFWTRCVHADLCGDTIPEYLAWNRQSQSGANDSVDFAQRFRDAARPNDPQERYAHLWDGGFPRSRRHYPLAWESIPEELPFYNRLAKKTRRLLMVLPWFTLGGADKFNLDLLHQLTQRDWQVTLVATAVGDYSRLPDFARHTPDISILPNFLPLKDYPRFLHYLIESRRIDTVLVSNSYVGYALLPYLRAHCPDVTFIDYVHNEDEDWKNGGYPRASMDHSEELDLTLTASMHLKSWMVERGGATERIEVCTINVDVAEWNPGRYDRSALRRDAAINPEIPVILFAGRLTKQKQPRMLAEVLLELARREVMFVCLVAGNGEEMPFLEDFLKSNQLDCVRLLGAVSAPRMRELMAMSDILFLPSRMEGISLAIYEALAMELVPVGANVGGQSELVTPECGFLVTPGPNERNDYVQILDALLRDPAHRKRMGRAARQRVVENFRIEQMSDRIALLFQRAEELAQQHPRPRISRELALEMTRLAVEYTRLEQATDRIWNEWEQITRDLRVRIEQFESQTARQQAVIAEREQALRAAEQRADAVETQTARLQEQLAEEESEIESIQRQLHDYETQTARLREQLAEKESEIESIQSQLRDSETQTARLQGKLTENIHSIDDLAAQRAALETRNAQLQLQLQTLLNTKSYRLTRPLSRIYGVLLKALRRETSSPAGASTELKSVNAKQKTWHHRPLVSVIIPCYNYGHYVEAAIDSVLCQTFQNLEIIVVDDGSTEPETVSRLEQLLRPKTRVLRQPNRGLPAARNAGIRQARGKYICCLDADDTLEPTYLEKALLLLESNPGIAFCYSWAQLFGDEQSLWRTEPFDLKNLLHYNHVPVSAVFARAAWKQVGGYCEEMRQGFEDWEFWLHLGERGWRGQLIPEALFNHRRHGQTMTHTAHAQQQQIIAFIERKHQPLFSDPSIVPKLQRRYYNARVDEPTLNVAKPEDYRPNKPALLALVPWLTAGGAEVVLYQVLGGLSHGQLDVFICTTLPNENEWHDRFYALTRNIYHLPNFLPGYAGEDFILNLIRTRNIQAVLLSGSESGYNLLPRLKATIPSLRVVNLLHNDSEWGYLRYSLQNDQYIDRHIVVHDGIAAKLQQEGNVSAPKISTILNGVDIDCRLNPEFYPTEALKERWQIPIDKKVITFIGRMDAEKQPEHFLELAARLASRPDAFFVMVGKGPLQASVEDQIARLGLRDCLRWYKGLPPEHIPEVLAVTDLLVLTSATEGMPLTALEALAMNVPVVGYDVGGIGWVIQDGVNGALVVPGDVELLCGRVVDLLSDAARLQNLKQRARFSLIERGFTATRMVEQYRQVLTSELEMARQPVN